jgi:hypothetical protein
MARNSRIVVPVLLLAVVSLLTAAFPLFGQSPRAYRSLAVMDLETSGVPETQMREIVDTLTVRIQETGAVRRVVNRQQRDKRLSRRATVELTGQYTQDQLNAAAILKLDLIVVGTLTWNRQQYVLKLRLLEVASGRPLFDEGRTVFNGGELLAACDELAIGIGAVATEAGSRKKAEREKREPLDLFLGFSLGQVGVSAGSGVDGGSYLYAQSLLMFNRNLGLGARYAFRLFPIIWEDHLLTADLRFQVPLEKDIFIILEGSYLLDFGGQGAVSHLVGARLSPIAGGEDEFLFELLPVALYFDLDTGEPVFMLQLLSLMVFFPL